MVSAGEETPIGGTRLDALLRRETGRAVPVSYDDLRSEARERLGDMAFRLHGRQRTYCHRKSASIRRLADPPRMLWDVSEVDLGVDLLGTACPAPMWLTPISVPTIGHEGGEIEDEDAFRVMIVSDGT